MSENESQTELFIREWRKDLGITQQELADRLNASKGWLSNIETGARDATLDSLRRIATAMGLELRQLFEPPGGKDHPSSDNVTGLWRAIPEGKRPQVREIMETFVPKSLDDKS